MAGYMRLTYATLATLVKYPWSSTHAKKHSCNKYNIFSTEFTLYEDIAHRVSLHHADGHHFIRHPMSFLAEAADDICYRLLDLEDAVDMEILSEQSVKDVFASVLAPEEGDRPLSYMRAKAIAHLIESCWKTFEREYDLIMQGNRTADLMDDLDACSRDMLYEIKKLYKQIFAHRQKIAVELGAYETLGRIMGTLTESVATLASTQNFYATDFLTQRRLQLVWGQQYAIDNQFQSYEWWLHQVMDFVSGLTDNYARQLSREIAGL